ncbi:hypothetical protein G7K_4522-t1 [Saitoella complicata NRRL Y-17804]|uniref:CFEM domain-containing protein n=1 Tax=Saitoella complicata (strain BCRC 22490 / CBS 7301 / JCM 7358 / NBRC 10748 / NRRL Y-17804) TaxID=698492 RepID=A0A0E9NL49_SAICN|nr:hypothetical protein G7K_4522-t1 [Saitoella complicata NRRL Y-17804]
MLIFNMLFSVLFTACLYMASIASAQSTDSIPACAVSCLTSLATSSGCSLTDFNCLCSSTSFVDSLTTCVTGACSATDQQTTFAYAENLCSSVGVTLPSLSALQASASAASSTGTSPATTSSTATSTSSSTTSAPTATVSAHSGGDERFAVRYGVIGVAGLVGGVALL